MKTLMTMALVLAMVALSAQAAPGNGQGRRSGGNPIYVTSQGLYFDTFAAVEALPDSGPFQKLEMGVSGAQTEFGPGDVGYLGGRWWVDLNNNQVMDLEDMYFLCPLLGRGRSEP
ncbi:hypothetical protein [Gallaecimonas xiamenensis]|nr:hypothetical protein [Gallaecimonas xiamenensis]